MNPAVAVESEAVAGASVDMVANGRESDRQKGDFEVESKSEVSEEDVI